MITWLRMEGRNCPGSAPCLELVLAAILMRSRGLSLKNEMNCRSARESCQRPRLPVVSELPLSRSVHGPPLATGKNSWVEHEGCETPKYAVRRKGLRQSFSGNGLSAEMGFPGELSRE